jgi:O-antigen ligase/tetratricopeptide (TPR) repeat protein
MYQRLSAALATTMEGIVLFLVVFSAWPFGSVHRYFQWVLLLGVAMLLALWAGRAIIEGRPRWVACPITVGLALLCALGMMQVVPLDAGWVYWFSPTTAALQDLVLPSPEELSTAGLSDSGTRTLSFDVAATRACLLQLMAVLALFAVVRNNLRHPGCLYRLAWVGTANGVLLVLVGMGQLASSPPNVVLWSFHTDGAVFATFICRNHFAYYANLCLGLAVGLLLGTHYFLTAPSMVSLSGRRSDITSGAAWRPILGDPRVLWLAVCVTILLAGTVACLSRGGVCGLIGGVGVATLLMIARRATPRLGLVAAVCTATVLLVGWLGFERVSRRWEQTLVDTAGENRPAVWNRSLELVARFPLTGTGLGTFGDAEPQTRRPGDPNSVYWDHAHNDFLELWVEGGAPQLLVALTIIVLVICQGVRAFWRHGDTGIGRLALGGLIGVIAVTVHSFVDFGLHIPAVAVLATVVAAILANLAEAPTPVEAAANADTPPTSSSLNAQVAALAQGVALVVVAWFLVSEGRRLEQAERYRLAAWRSLDERQVDYLRSAVALAPGQADLHVALTDALVRRADQTVLNAQVQLAASISPWIGSSTAATTLAVTFRMPALAAHGPDMAAAHRHALLAQLASPLSADAHQRFLKLALRRGDDPARPLARLMRLTPSDPTVWYTAGILALRRGDRVETWHAWRNCLQTGSTHLKEILAAVPERLTAVELLDHVLPPNPGQIVDVAEALPHHYLRPAERERYWRTALSLLRVASAPTTAENSLLEARLHARLDEIPDALRAYEAAVATKPLNADLRFELGEFLHRNGHFAEARQQLLLVLAQQPDNRAAQALYERVLHDVAESR